MTSMLPDVNVWLALSYDLHPHHEVTKRWFATVGRDSLFFCRVTQLGLLRLLTNRMVVGSGVLNQRGAWQAYGQLLADRRIGFMKEPAGLDEVFRRRSDREEVSLKRWTDDYLAAFAESAGVRLVTLDQALAERASDSVLLR